MAQQDLAPAGRRYRVLLVEDHQDTAEMIALLLEEEDYTVEWVGRAADALEACARNREAGLEPHAILMDLTLPDMDAVELMSRLSECLESRPPVIVISAKPAAAIKKAAKDMGAADVISKPFSIDVLLSSVEAIVRAPSNGASTTYPK